MTGGPPIPVCRGVTALRHAAVLGGKPPQARPRGALRGSASSVTAVTCLWTPTRRCSAPVTRPRGPVPAAA